MYSPGRENQLKNLNGNVMQIKSEWIYTICLGVMLSVLSVPVNAYVMAFIFRCVQIDTYIAWSLSTIPSAFLISLPMGLFILKTKPFFFGGLTGFVAVIGLILMNATLRGAFPSAAFVIEYISLIVFSGVAAYLGYFFKDHWRAVRTGKGNRGK